MKCQNCGKNEANFHYTSNVNGNVNEVHLCNECSEKLGYSNNVFFDTDRFFGGIMSDFFGPSFARMAPFIGRPMLSSAPDVRVQVKQEGAPAAAAVNHAPAPLSPVDPELNKRRELNALKAQMYSAVQSEEFEKAAEIRDRIKAMEQSN